MSATPATPTTEASAEPVARSTLQAADAEWVANYLTHCRGNKHLADRTLTLYQRSLAQLLQHAWLAEVGVLSVQDHHIRQWAGQLQASGRRARGMALMLSAWRGFYAWLGREGRIAANPVCDVHAPRLPKSAPKAMAVDEALRLADHTVADDDPWLEARDAAMVELLYGCGLRVSELLSLDVSASEAALHAGRGWVDWHAGEVQVQGQRGRRRSVPLGRMAHQALLRWLPFRDSAVKPAPERACAEQGDGCDAAQALFLGKRGVRMTAHAVRQRLRRRALSAGLSTPVHPHMLRHSCASHVLQSSQDVRAVQALMGHAHIASTQIYARLDFQHLAKTYEGAHPRAKRKPSGAE